jgi:hypothetical protein
MFFVLCYCVQLKKICVGLKPQHTFPFFFHNTLSKCDIQKKITCTLKVLNFFSGVVVFYSILAEIVKRGLCKIKQTKRLVFSNFTPVQASECPCK